MIDVAESKTLTVGPHDVLQRVQVLDLGLVSAEDLGSGTEVVGEVLPVLLPHLPVATQSIDLLVEGDVVGRPVACRKHRGEAATVSQTQRTQ